jgi:hypothetical protein
VFDFFSGGGTIDKLCEYSGIPDIKKENLHHDMFQSGSTPIVSGKSQLSIKGSVDYLIYSG